VSGAALLALLLIVGLVWLRSGRDPLYWLIAVLVIVRACVAQAADEGWAAACRFVRALPAAIERSRGECLGVRR
jgi:hypothetical protein